MMMFLDVWDLKSAHDMWMALRAFYDDSSTSDDGKFKKEDDHKVKAHECVEHNHNLVIVEDYSTSWSSDDDDDATTKSLDKVDGDASSDAHYDPTPCTLDDDDDDGSCSGHDCDATTSPSTTPHCFMS